MYTHCIYCVGPLRTNTEIEHFPVGRQLAFDEAKGRLWVVCPRCGRWNLTPIETRWEAIETCARAFAGATLRSSTSSVGLARLDSGLELIRIGAPDRKEFAAWRYGRVFTARRRRAYATAASMAIVAAGTLSLQHLNPAAYAALPLAALLPHLGSFLMLYRATVQPIARVADPSGVEVMIRGTSVSRLRLLPSEDGVNGWQLQIPTGNGHALLNGDAASRVLARVLAHTNRPGGSAGMVRRAVQQLETRGTGREFLQDYARRHAGVVADPMHARLNADWLALEMALHEDSEHDAVQGDLAALEVAWREAEELAQIADNLLLPAWVTARLERWRNG